ncbi:hypothetical protein AB0M80_19780 [Amycolatopsis sp. NPDC051045]|uniref:hypothetical protein n=1 Tax=Amycolatopsis sp. NPDC051045 TaxID=3156922 RepID=UPI0034291646
MNEAHAEIPPQPPIALKPSGGVNAIPVTVTPWSGSSSGWFQLAVAHCFPSPSGSLLPPTGSWAITIATSPLPVGLGASGPDGSMLGLPELDVSAGGDDSGAELSTPGSDGVEQPDTPNPRTVAATNSARRIDRNEFIVVPPCLAEPRAQGVIRGRTASYEDLLEPPQYSARRRIPHIPRMAQSMVLRTEGRRKAVSGS